MKPARIEFEARDRKVSSLEFLIAETAHLDLHGFGEFVGEIIHVNTRAAVNVWRIFVGEEEHLHEALLIARAPQRTQIYGPAF